MAKSKPLNPFWWASLFTAAVGMVAGQKWGAELGWVGFGATGLSCWFIHNWWRPLADCAYCRGRAKRRGQDGDGTTFHRCIWPKWLGGCGGRGERKRLLTAITGYGLGRK